MLDQFFQQFQETKEHWLFWPFAILVLLIAIYSLVFSQNGYIAYKRKLESKNSVAAKVIELRNYKRELENRLGDLKNDDMARAKFAQEHLLYGKDVTIIKFKDDKVEVFSPEVKSENISSYQRVYILVASIVLLLSIFFQWTQARRPPHEN